MEHQIHFGRKFYLAKKNWYWYSTDYPRIFAHRWVWINHHGVIPKGYHIHHKDENKSNNSIENLELIEASRHLSLHAQSPERKKFGSELCNKIRHLTKAWHGSEEGRAWHKYHAIKCKFGKWDPKKYNCKICQKEYQTSKRSNTHFCSNACKSRWRRDSGLDDIEKECVFCHSKFKINKYSKTKTCNRKCGGQMIWITRRSNSQ